MKLVMGLLMGLLAFQGNSVSAHIVDDEGSESSSSRSRRATIAPDETLGCDSTLHLVLRLRGGEAESAVTSTPTMPYFAVALELIQTTLEVRHFLQILEVIQFLGEATKAPEKVALADAVPGSEERHRHVDGREVWKTPGGVITKTYQPAAKSIRETSSVEEPPKVEKVLAVVPVQRRNPTESSSDFLESAMQAFEEGLARCVAFGASNCLPRPPFRVWSCGSLADRAVRRLMAPEGDSTAVARVGTPPKPARPRICDVHTPDSGHGHGEGGDPSSEKKASKPLQNALVDDGEAGGDPFGTTETELMSLGDPSAGLSDEERQARDARDSAFRLGLERARDALKEDVVEFARRINASAQTGFHRFWGGLSSLFMPEGSTVVIQPVPSKQKKEKVD